MTTRKEWVTDMTQRRPMITSTGALLKIASLIEEQDHALRARADKDKKAEKYTIFSILIKIVKCRPAPAACPRDPRNLVLSLLQSMDPTAKP